MNATVTSVDEPRNETIAEILNTHPFFEGLTKHHRDLLAEAALMKTFSEGEEIFREGDPANRFYLILDGEIEIESEDEQGEWKPVQRIGAGDVLGWSWIIPPWHWTFGARAVRETRALFFYASWLRESCERDPEFGYAMLKRMTHTLLSRLQAVRRHAHLTREPCGTRAGH